MVQFEFLRFTVFVGGYAGAPDGKESACNAGDPGSIPGSGRSPGEGNGNPLQPSCLENPSCLEGLRSIGEMCPPRHCNLIGYSPWGHKESDTTERLHFTSLHFTIYRVREGSWQFSLFMIHPLPLHLLKELYNSGEFKWLQTASCKPSAVVYPFINLYLRWVSSSQPRTDAG